MTGNMGRKLIAVCVWLLAVIMPSLADSGLAHAAPLVIAVEDAAAPWSGPDGTGYANDLVREAYRAVGVEVQFKVVPYARCKRLVVGGDVVACFNMSPEPGLEKEVTFADQPLFMINFDYFHNRKKPLHVKREKDIAKGTTIGIVNGYEYPKSAMQLKEQGVVFQEARDEVSNLKKLAQGRIDAAIINQNETKPALSMIHQAGVQGKVAFLFRSGTMGTYIGFSNRHLQGKQARILFNQGFRVIRKNGTLQRITADWAARAAVRETP